MLSNPTSPCGATPAATSPSNPPVLVSQQPASEPSTFELEGLIENLTKLVESTARAQDTIRPDGYSHDALLSARNLAAYCAIRSDDLRPLQPKLHKLGVSSLGRGETHIEDSLKQVLLILRRLGGKATSTFETTSVNFETGMEILRTRTEALFGPIPQNRLTHIMVTMPSEAATDHGIIRNLLSAGMDVMRVNFAHDQRDQWRAMIQNLGAARKELGKPCKVLCDLAGPKFRTGPVEVGPGVVRYHPFRNEYGQMCEAAEVWISSNPPPSLADGVLPVAESFWKKARVGDRLHFHDYQGRERWLTVGEVKNDGLWALAERGAFVVEGIKLTLERGGQKLDLSTPVLALPVMPLQIALTVGDILLVTSDKVLGKPAQLDDEGRVLHPAQIGCTLPEALRDARSGERILFDDGKIAGVIEEVTRDHLKVRITWTRSAYARLTSEKGINLPDTDLRIPTLTDKDRVDLEFIASLGDSVDIIGLPFTRDAQSVIDLYAELGRLNLKHIGVELKIETKGGFDHLPEIIFTGLKRDVVGLMIAKGDLAVEVGFDRLAEVQEEMLAFAAAAHLPITWATQVLETLAKKGMPSRAEISDVVSGHRSQCIMLNKGPHIVTAVTFLRNLLERMERHQAGLFRWLPRLEVASGWIRASRD